MKKSILSLLFTLIALISFSKEVPYNRALQIAENIILNYSKNLLKSSVSEQLTNITDLLTEKQHNAHKLKSDAKNSELYIFYKKNGGFIIVSGNDITVPVLGYSNTGTIDTTNLPIEFISIINQYKYQIQYLKEQNLEQTEKIKFLWDNLGNNKLKSSKSFVDPLITSQWHQHPFYNDICPYDDEFKENTVTGCVATAMAQIMKYWEFPKQGTGFHMYQDEKYGVISANFGITTYNWELMPHKVSSENSTVATLLYHCGVAVEMNYNVAKEGGSSSYLIINDNKYHTKEQTAEYAYKTYFGYSSSLQGIKRADYTDEQWNTIIKSELDAGRPVQYAGYGHGGHSFICDGYDENDYFHINWGWGGTFDGYFILNALNLERSEPEVITYSFNEEQMALIGIQPAETNNTYNLTLSKDLTIEDTNLIYGADFGVSTDIVNTGTGLFNGDFCAAVFDKNNVFIDYIEVLANQTLNANNHYTNGISFNSDGIAGMLPGTYSIYIYYRPKNGEWKSLRASTENDEIVDFIDVTVIHNKEIEIASTPIFSTESIYSNESVSIWLNVLNKSENDFVGDLNLSLFNFKGELISTIEEKESVTIPAKGSLSDGITFKTDNIKVESGTYLLALFHKWDDKFELSGSSNTFLNPVKITIKETPLNKDVYEDNNNVEMAYKLNPFYLNNHAEISTLGANIHRGNDTDYYSLKLDDGYKYSINCSLGDISNASQLNNFSVNAVFMYSLDGINWSQSFDQELLNKITLTGNSILYFNIIPYFSGETGTYRLNINVSREEISQMSEFNNIQLQITPNPTTDFINISSAENIESYKLVDLKGRHIKKEFINSRQFKIDLCNFPEGIYLLELNTNAQSSIRKIVKQ